MVPQKVITVVCKNDEPAGVPLPPVSTKRRRNPPGHPDPEAEVVALSPRALLATNRYICEVCHKGFQRDQNLQLHRRGHNLPWKLKQRSNNEVKKRVYVCPEVTCAHHDPTRALGDLTGIKKHYSRKHGEKKWKCDKCSKRYAVQSDWKAHSKICGTKEYRCDCGTIFSRKDSFVTHRAFCDALTEENFRASHGLAAIVNNLHAQSHHELISHSIPSLNSSIMEDSAAKSLPLNPLIHSSSDFLYNNHGGLRASGLHLSGGSSIMSATALLQKAAEMGPKVSDDSMSSALLRGFSSEVSSEAGKAARAYAGTQAALHMSSRRGAESLGLRAESFVNLQMGGGERKIDTIGHHRRADWFGEEVGEGTNRRMTQDFLGLGSAGNVEYHEDDIYSYQSMAQGREMWDY
ncbi:Zinc finger protein MAGPIE [Apostasia shenzhenica]|uniref:Protein EARLY HEADING DATE 2 n=1 Tax=Apostasia shenzhenica TaxID=1088818 RepID=A0A2H9ZWC1_9ASPA|nr:Zinc finger protein MAGPIE [Apostasia shenzhenica]